MEALLYETISSDIVKCHLCHHRCSILHAHRGLCGVRQNMDGTLHSLSYGQTAAISVDPVEKKPLYHFMPKTMTYSLATPGCNMNCQWCQNHSLSQQPKPNEDVQGTYVSPQQHLDRAMKHLCPSISYTYSEPTIYLEYALDIMKLAHKQGIKNIWVTNGYMTPEALELILPYLDAANVDYKGSDESIYRDYCQGQPQPILDNIKTMYEYGVHVEVTSLIIPSINDSTEQIKAMAEDIASISPTIVWHISRFFPHYKMKHISPTPMETLHRAKRIGHAVGLKHIYLGNV